MTSLFPNTGFGRKLFSAGDRRRPPRHRLERDLGRPWLPRAAGAGLRHQPVIPGRRRGGAGLRHAIYGAGPRRTLDAHPVRLRECPRGQPHGHGPGQLLPGVRAGPAGHAHGARRLRARLAKRTSGCDPPDGGRRPRRDAIAARRLERPPGPHHRPGVGEDAVQRWDRRAGRPYRSRPAAAQGHAPQEGDPRPEPHGRPVGGRRVRPLAGTDHGLAQQRARDRARRPAGDG